MSITQTPRIAALAERYGQAWNNHDVEAIMADHTEDSVFHLHLVGFEAARGAAAVHAQFEAFFALWPDMHFATKRLHVGEGLFVHEFRFQGTLAQPLRVGDEVAQPGGSVDVDGVDVIPCRGGQVARKDTYMDALALRSQLGLG